MPLKGVNLPWGNFVVSPLLQAGERIVSFVCILTNGGVTRKAHSFVSCTAGIESLVTLIQENILHRITHTSE